MEASTLLFPAPAAKYGGALASPSAQVSDVASPLPSVAGPSPVNASPAWHPDSPMFWFAVIAATAVGLAYASTTVRVGPVSGSVSAGKK